jgi:hypothetical protein
LHALAVVSSIYVLILLLDCVWSCRTPPSVSKLRSHHQDWSGFCGCPPHFRQHSRHHRTYCFSGHAGQVIVHRYGSDHPHEDAGFGLLTMAGAANNFAVFEMHGWAIY